MNNNHTAFDPVDRRVLERSGIASTLAANPEMRFDGEEDASLYFARELDYVKAKTYDRVYPELTALQMFPVTHEVPEGAETVTYYGYEKRGLARIIANYADDLPRADVAGQPKTAHVKAMGDSYGYSVQDMLKLYPRAGTKVTLAPENLPHLVGAVQHLYALGYHNIYANCVFEDVWRQQHPQLFYDKLVELADWMIDNEVYKDLYISLFEERFVPKRRKLLFLNK